MKRLPKQKDLPLFVNNFSNESFQNQSQKSETALLQKQFFEERSKILGEAIKDTNKNRTSR